MSDFVTLHEVGPRDGLQNEARIIPVAQKVALIDTLAQSGLKHIEIGSFVSPKWVPQMADTAEVLGKVAPAPVQFAVLVPNMRGWEGFLGAARVDVDYQVAVFISASEGFSQSNLNCSVKESIARLAPVLNAARAEGIATRGYVSCVSDCPFDGPTDPAQVADTVGKLRDLGAMPISLGDTLGRATPDRISAMLEAVLNVAPAAELAGHYHDTGGRALENIRVSLALGLRDFDSAVGGLGGCPYAPNAPGNVATEAVLAMLTAYGYETGVDAGIIAKAAKMAEDMRR